jgi:hypothetical protein
MDRSLLVLTSASLIREGAHIHAPSPTPQATSAARLKNRAARKKI